MQTPAQVAKRANVTAQTIRNYSTDYAAHLSPSASGADGPRLYTDEDVDVLCTVASLRKSGMPPGEIAEALSRQTPPIVDAAANAPSNTPQKGLNAAQGEPLGFQIVYNAVEGRLGVLERRFEARERQALLWATGMGIWVGMILMAAIFFAVWLAVNGL